MYGQNIFVDFAYRLRWAVADSVRHLQRAWCRANKVLWAFFIMAGAIVGGLWFAMQSVFAVHDERRHGIREFHVRQLSCLARNVYYEARGEPVAGQFAVAEVTMNRKASGHYPKTVCDVVHQQNWDPIRRRSVGAFSWTELNSLPEPTGEAWERAQRIAETVYFEKHVPLMQGALFFHATYVKPDWAKKKKRIAQIGRHVFYE